MKKVVIFGGGTGITYLLQGLKLFPVDITTVISVSDDGFSTGKLREEFNIPAVGDIRKVIVSLSNIDDKIKELLEYRFDTNSDLNGHPIGNLIMVGMYNKTGSLLESIKVLSNFLDVKYKVLPLSEDYLTLMGETEQNQIIEGEKNIGLSNQPYKKLYYKEEPHVLKDVLAAVEEADLIILSMGSVLTSILPHLICKEVIDALNKTKAKIMYSCNAVTQPGETDNFKVSDHIKLLNQYLKRRKIDIVVAAKSKIPKDIVKKYETTEQKDLVKIDRNEINKLGCKLLTEDMLILEDNMIRHDSLKLANVIFNYLMR